MPTNDRCLTLDSLDKTGQGVYPGAMRTTVSQEGQVTIPKACRDKLGLSPGTTLDFQTVQGQLVARKVQPEDVFRKWRGKGKLPGGISVDAYLASIRE